MRRMAEENEKQKAELEKLRTGNTKESGEEEEEKKGGDEPQPGQKA